VFLLFPLAGIVCYPLTVTPLAVAQEASIRLVDAAVAAREPMVVATLRTAVAPGVATAADVYPIACRALVHRLLRLHDGTLRVAIQGLDRVRILGQAGDDPAQVAIEALPDAEGDDPQGFAQLRGLIDVRLQQLPAGAELRAQLAAAEGPEHYLYLAAAGLLARHSVAERYDVLAAGSSGERIARLAELLG
jgi:ATP-dependent Lon protease